MKLRDIDFGDVLAASGVQGFFGEGYWFHKPWHRFGLDFSGMTFVAKTTTYAANQGNMPLGKNYTPQEFFPPCVKVRFIKAVMLNAVGLSNPGLGALLNENKWQKRKKPFFISLMSLATTTQKRLEEFGCMVEMIGNYINRFSAPFALQINLSCPNTGHNFAELINESAKVLEIANVLGVPLMPKYSIASASINAVLELQNHPACDAICVSNTLPFGWKEIDWKKVWGSDVSPLTHLGGGGLSGRTLCPLVCTWIKILRDKGFTKPINGGGGILHKKDVERYHKSGASSIFLGSCAILRPWRVASIIKHAKSLQWS